MIVSFCLGGDFYMVWEENSLYAFTSGILHLFPPQFSLIPHHSVSYRHDKCDVETLGWFILFTVMLLVNHSRNESHQTWPGKRQLEPLVSIIFHTFDFCFPSVGKFCDWVDSFGWFHKYSSYACASLCIGGVCRGSAVGRVGRTALRAKINKN